ncbi:P-loop NTPase family protein [Streptomyces gibsoniae]|uniref:Thymidylate kinase n=1 Tax=Streptomyces gibsoniae TaxID=3075529 RepID=A0ABU2TXU3_9ACTN|nr:hypothetical protein [Streptomyces sp. DSM 41699]MDT0465660.1 hypothetical protein [Streptomyces sp. DSM 41699]
MLYVAHYGVMLAGLLADHPGRTHCFYLDVPFEETLLRHATKPIADEVDEAQLRSWYRPLDLLHGAVATVVPAAGSLSDTIDLVMRTAALTPRATPPAVR